MRPLRCPQRGSNSRRGIVTRAAGEGPRDAGIDGQCESAHEADPRCNDSRRRSKEAEARRRSYSCRFHGFQTMLERPTAGRMTLRVESKVAARASAGWPEQRRLVAMTTCDGVATAWR